MCQITYLHAAIKENIRREMLESCFGVKRIQFSVFSLTVIFALQRQLLGINWLVVRRLLSPVFAYKPMNTPAAQPHGTLFATLTSYKGILPLQLRALLFIITIQPSNE